MTGADDAESIKPTTVRIPMNRDIELPFRSYELVSVVVRIRWEFPRQEGHYDQDTAEKKSDQPEG